MTDVFVAQLSGRRLKARSNEVILLGCQPSYGSSPQLIRLAAEGQKDVSIVEGEMFARLIEIHAELLGALKALEDLTLSPMPHREALAQARWRRSRANADRARLLETEVYPVLLDHLTEAEAGPARKLQSDSNEFQNASTAHVLRWPIDKAVAEWDDYCRAAMAMRSTRRRQIEAERAILYPLLMRLGSGLAAGAGIDEPAIAKWAA